MAYRLLVPALLILALAGLGFWYFGRTPSPPPETPPAAGPNFTAEGNVTRDNPGQKPGVWYLIYERPGAPALSLELEFERMDAPPLVQGDRVRVEGFLRNSTLSVSSIRIP